MMQVHRVVLDLLVQLEQIHVLLHHGVGRVVGEDVRDALFKMPAGGAGEHEDRLHVQFHQELREGDDVVGIADDRHAFAVEVLVHVAHGVEQAAAFLANGGGHVHAAVVAERMDERVGVASDHRAIPAARREPCISRPVRWPPDARRSGPAQWCRRCRRQI